MPIILNVDHERKEVHCVAVGPISFADVESHLASEKHFEGLAYKEFVDARGAGISFTPAEIRKIVDLLRGMARQSKLGPSAILVSGDLAYGILRMIEALVEDVCDIKPFRDEATARAWLAAQ
jgi:hypothetical protein